MNVKVDVKSNFDPSLFVFLIQLCDGLCQAVLLLMPSHTLINAIISLQKTGYVRKKNPKEIFSE